MSHTHAMTGEGHPRTGGWVARPRPSRASHGARSWHVTWPNAHGVGWGGVCPAAGTRSQPSMRARTRRMGSSRAPPPRSGAATYIESDSTRPSRSRGHAASSPPHSACTHALLAAAAVVSRRGGDPPPAGPPPSPLRLSPTPTASPPLRSSPNPT
jgi:hypothetical protein